MHRDYEVRLDKLTLNTLALHGGRPYIDARLTRFAGESSIDWSGTSGFSSQFRFDTNSNYVEGRKSRAYLVNNAARIAEKIRQYVFARRPERKEATKANTEMIADITRQGDSLNAFMGDVLRNLVATKWCWIGVDAPQVEGQISLKDAEGGKIRPYWRLYSATDVVDWHMDDTGKISWLLTEGTKWDNSNPFEQSTVMPVRRLWTPGRMIEYTLEVPESGGQRKVTDTQVFEIDFDEVPFVLCGEVAPQPHWFDDVEDIQHAILDLESSIDTLMHKVVFAQMILPSSVGNDPTGENQGTDLAQRVEAIVGLSNAILEGPEDKGITRFIGPDAGAMGKMQEELGRKTAVLFDTVGLHLNFTKNFSESADSKHFDHLDPQAVLRNYAQQIAECERKAWEMTAKWDKNVAVINPAYSDKFRVSNIYEDFKSLVLAANMDLPDSVMRLVNRAATDTVLEISNLSLTEGEAEEISADLDEQEFATPVLLDAASMAGKTVAGVTKQATDDGVGVRQSGAE